MPAPLVTRARVHAALGEPIRLAIVDELAVSDRSPHELAVQLCVSSNLLAHHLDVLESVGLVERSASTGDRRRRYVRLRDHALLLDRPAASVPGPGSVLFVCTHNSARSQLAAALWNARGDSPDRGPARSAGTHPATDVHPGAIAAGHRAGLDLSDAVPVQLTSTDADADLVVTVCDRAHEELRPPPSWRHWSISDPVPIGTDQAFDAVVAELDTRLGALT